MVEVLEPEDGVEETQETGETEEPAQEEAAETSEPRKPSDEMKIVIIMRGSRSMIGVQSPDCDPVFETFDGDLSESLARVPALVESANAKWDASPRYPKAKLPEPPPQTTTAVTRGQAAPAKPKPKQPSFF